MRDVLEAMLTLLESGEQGAVATVIATQGSTPQLAGARMLLYADGRTVGTVGGGAIEHDVRRELAAVIERGEARVLRRDLGRDLGMSCGGSMELFLEPVSSLPRLILFGAGHVAHATARVARNLGFRLVIVDARPDHNDETRFPGCTRLLLEPEHAATALTSTQDDWFVCLSHSHALDARAVAAIATRPLRYLGIMGSRRKIYRMMRDLHARGVPLPLDRIYAPIGLALGAVTPDEIAISIASELVALRRGQPARHMRAIDDPALRDLLTP